MNLLHNTEELSRFENELFLLIIDNSKNSSFSNRDNSSEFVSCDIRCGRCKVTFLGRQTIGSPMLWLPAHRHMWRRRWIV